MNISVVFNQVVISEFILVSGASELCFGVEREWDNLLEDMSGRHALGTPSS